MYYFHIFLHTSGTKCRNNTENFEMHLFLSHIHIAQRGEPVLNGHLPYATTPASSLEWLFNVQGCDWPTVKKAEKAHG